MKIPKSSLSERVRSKVEFGRLHVKSAWGPIRISIGHVKRAAKRRYAMQWQRLYRMQNLLSFWKARYGAVATTAFFIFLVTVSGYLAPTLQGVLEPYFSDDVRFAGFRTLLLTLGGSLIGAAAIAFTLVMFAMQVNVERIPHGLFRKFSSDSKLLGAFVATFLLAVSITTMSIIPDKSWLAIATLAACWGTGLIMVLFLYAYRRALSLINPTQQLALVVVDARRDLQAHARRARRVAPLLDGENQKTAEQGSLSRPAHDLPRVGYFQNNPHWTAVAQRAILYSISFARRYSEQGDHEVARVALSAVIEINAAYVEAKGKTFFANVLMFDHPLVTDGFINDTLEHLRQNVQIGISRGDEQQIEQTVRAIAALCRIFLNIDYSTEYASKTHAHLATAYLSRAVQSVVPHDMPDVLMEGVRLMGEVGQRMLNIGAVKEIATISEKIALISCTGVAKEDYRPVILVGMEQLARLTFELIRGKSSDIHFAAGKIRGDVSLVTKLFLKLPDISLSSIHSSFLAPYYSGTSATALPARLSELVDALANAKADDEAAQRVIRNIKQWADGLYQTEKEIFLAAIEKKSPFTIDIVYWISHVMKLLIAVSNAPACNDHTRDELRKSALWFILVLSWVPDEKEAVTFVENFDMTETLFDAAVDAHNLDCDEVAEEARGLLLSWAFKAGKYESGWAILERACYALATLDLMEEKDGSALITEISDLLARDNAPDQAIRDRAARELRERVATHDLDRYSLSRIEHAMGQTDQGKLRLLLEGLANRLSPGTADEPIPPHTF